METVCELPMECIRPFVKLLCIYFNTTNSTCGTKNKHPIHALCKKHIANRWLFQKSDTAELTIQLVLCVTYPALQTTCGVLTLTVSLLGTDAVKCTRCQYTVGARCRTELTYKLKTV